VDVRLLAGRLAALLCDHDAASLEARLHEWRREAATAQEADALARLAQKALELKPLIDAHAMSREELAQALELMLRLALEGGQPIR
jgi:hypothetical protein